MHVVSRLSPLVLIAALAACSNSSNSNPTPVITPQPVVNGQVLVVRLANPSQVVSGATVVISSAVTTNGNGGSVPSGTIYATGLTNVNGIYAYTFNPTPSGQICFTATLNGGSSSSSSVNCQNPLTNPSPTLSL